MADFSLLHELFRLLLATDMQLHADFNGAHTS